MNISMNIPRLQGNVIGVAVTKIEEKKRNFTDTAKTIKTKINTA